MIRRIIQLSILMVGLLLTSGVWANTYYIDWVNGADTNNGTSKSTPWKRAPGMRGCSDNCLVRKNLYKVNSTAGAGDQFILKGGVTWPLDALSWDWYYGSGTEANPIYFGVDQAWYTGASWTRPKLDAEGGVPNVSPNGVYAMFRAYGTWFVVDNIEFTGLAQLANAGPSGPVMLSFGTSSPSAGEVKNCYFHGWSHGGIATQDRMIVLGSQLQTASPDLNLRIHDNVWDGSDTTKDMTMAYKGSAGHIYNNYIGYMTNGFVTGNARYIWGNTFDHIGDTLSFDPTAHMNSVENMAGISIIYNNYFISPSGGATIITNNKDGQTDYVFNNVIVDDKNQGIQIYNSGFATGENTNTYVFNNIFHANAAVLTRRISGPSNAGYPYITNGFAINNYLIGANPTINLNMTTNQTINNNIRITNAEATAAGYVATGRYPFYPPDRGGVTDGAGKDLRSIAAGIPSTTISDAATAALSSTSCGVKYDAVNHRVIGPNITPRIRGTKWDVGAHQSVSPPQNLRIKP